MPRVARKLTHSRGAIPVANRYCETCDKEFSRPSELHRHLERTLIHNPNARKFKCRFCDTTLTQKCNIRTHELQHTNQKERCGLPQTVDSSGTLMECTFACSDPSSMNRHIENKHIAPYSRSGEPVPEWLEQGLQARLAVKLASRHALHLYNASFNSSSPLGFPRLESSTPTLSAGTPPTEVYEVSTQNIPRGDDTITSNTFPIVLPDFEMDLTNSNCNPSQLLEVPTFSAPQNEESMSYAVPALFPQGADAEFSQFFLHLPQFDGQQIFVPNNHSNIGGLISPAEATTTHFGDVDFALLLDSASQMNYEVPPVGDGLSPLNFFSPVGPEVQLDLYNFPESGSY